MPAAASAAVCARTAVLSSDRSWLSFLLPQTFSFPNNCLATTSAAPYACTQCTPGTAGAGGGLLSPHAAAMPLTALRLPVLPGLQGSGARGIPPLAPPPANRWGCPTADSAPRGCRFVLPTRAALQNATPRAVCASPPTGTATTCISLGAAVLCGGVRGVDRLRDCAHTVHL